MTTTVNVQAHCDSRLEVKVTVTEGENVTQTVTLDNGETTNLYAYGNRVITVTEQPKE